MKLQLKETVCRKRSFWSHASIFQTRFLFLHYFTAHCRRLDNHWNHPGHQKKKKKIILSSLNSPELPNMNSWSCWLVAKLCPTLATPRTVAHRAPLSMGFPRQEYWSGAPFPSPGGLPDSGAEPRLLRWQADSLPLRHVGSPLERSGARSLWFRRLPR